MADGTDRVSPFDIAVSPSADGSTGLWWREWHKPQISEPTDFLIGRLPQGNLVPAGPMPGAMMADGAPAWIGMLRLFRRNSRFHFRLAAEIPFDTEEGRSFQHPGPQFTEPVEASLRIVIQYRTHVLTLTPPVAQQDPYSVPTPAGQAAALSAMLAAMDADQAASTVQSAGVALVNAAAGYSADVSDPADPTLGVPGAEEIARSLSPTDVVLFALEIRHPDIPTPARVVNDAVDHTIGGETYAALRFDAAPISDEEGRPPRAELQIDNVGQVLTEWLERAQGGAGATVRAMQVLARTHEVEWEMTVSVLNVEVRERIHVRLGWDPLLNRVAVVPRHDRYTSPGAF